MEEISTKQQNNSVKENLLTVDNVHFAYNKNQNLLNGIDLTIRKGEIIGISGENGSGKTTLLKILVGLLEPKKGRIKKTGRIGYSPQNLLLFDNLSTMENFVVFGKGMGLTEKEINKQASKIMKQLNFAKYKNIRVKNLSGGTKQKLNFGISILGDPNILVLDEPYQGMDYASFTEFWNIQYQMRSEGKAIIIVSHILEDTEKFSRSLHLINGQLQGCNRNDCPMGCE